MNRFTLLAASATVGLTAAASAALPLAVSADSLTACTVKAVGVKNTVGASDSRFTVADNIATVQVSVTGTNCNEPVTIASWQAPDADKGMPYSAQKLYMHNTAVLTTGTHAMSVQLPNCYYQVDVVLGSSATDTKGGPEYGTNGNIKVIGSLHGGTTACVTPTTGGSGEATPTPPAVEAATAPTTLPNTGSGSAAVILAGIGSLIGALVWNRRQAGKVTA